MGNATHHATLDWSDCSAVESVPDKVSGNSVFKGTRLPADTIVDNVDAYMDEGLSRDQAIQATLESFPSVPNGVEGICALLAYRDAREQQSVA